jgi:hypothetical protein
MKEGRKVMPGLKDFLRKLSERERMLLFGTVPLLVFFLIYQFGVYPFVRSRERFRVENSELVTRLQELKSIAEKYVAEKAYYDELGDVLKEKKSLSVLTYLENIAGELGIRGGIEYIRPKGSETKEGITSLGVEMKIDAIEVQKLIMYLYTIEERRNGLTASNLRLKPFFREKGKVDVIVTVTDVTAD